MRIFYSYLIAICIIVAISASVFFLFPALQSYFLDENSLIENFSALFFFIASLTCFYGFIKGINKVLSGVFCLVSGLGFLEELSFGKVVKHYRSPKLLGKDIDSLHDFLDVFVMGWDQYPVIIGLVVASLFAMLSFLFIILYRNRQAVLYAFGKINVTAFVAILLIIAMLIIMSQVFDLEVVNQGSSNLAFFEEIFEMNAALGFVYLSRLIVRKEDC